MVTFYLLFVMEIATRRVHFAGCTPNPDGRWMMQITTNLTDAEDGFLKGKRYVLMDRDGKCSPAFQAILKTEGVDAVLLPAKSPNLNAHSVALLDRCCTRAADFCAGTGHAMKDRDLSGWNRPPRTIASAEIAASCRIQAPAAKGFDARRSFLAIRASGRGVCDRPNDVPHAISQAYS